MTNRDFQLLSGEIILQPVVDLPLEFLILGGLLNLLCLLLLIAHKIFFILILGKEINIGHRQFNGPGRFGDMTC